ncbi:MAG: hypothetical protein KDA96_12450 [Planctomycetaceae bacterium]|nr:hypothetical protein [Planctomycetaceae bacterium]
MTDETSAESDDLFAPFEQSMKNLASPEDSIAAAGGGLQPQAPEDQTNADEQIRDYLGFMHRAKEAHQQQISARLMSALVTDQLPNGHLPEIKKLKLTPGCSKFLFSERHAPTKLDPKDYGEVVDVSRLGLGGGLEQSVDAYGDSESTGAFQERSGVLICEIPEQILLFTLTLPDYDSFRMGGQNQFLELSMEKEELARELGRVFEDARLKTKDGICTGVRIQMEVAVSNPERLVETYCRAYVRRLKKQYADFDKRLGNQPRTPGWAKKLVFPLRLLSQVCLGARQHGSIPLPQVSLAHVYKRIRLEAADAVRDAVRQEDASKLIEEPAQVRDRIAGSLTGHVQKSMAIYGAEIKRIVSIECVSPEYNRMIIDRGRLKLRETRLKDDKSRADIELKELEVETQRYNDQLHSQQVRKRKTAEEEAETIRRQLQELGKTREEEDRVRAEVQQRQLQREADEATHRRQQQKLNAETEAAIRQQQELNALKIEAVRQVLQQKKISAAMAANLEYEKAQHTLQQDALDKEHKRQEDSLKLQFEQQMKSNEAEMNSRISFLEKFAGLSADIPEEKLLVMALAGNPQLAKPYVEATRARGKEELIQKMDEFRHQLVSVHGKEDQLVHQLWQEGIRQIGMVLQKQAEKPSTNVFGTYTPGSE